MKRGSDEAWYDAASQSHGHGRVHFSSCHLTMRDGIRIAISVFVPVGPAVDARLPVILHQTRYFRSMELRFPARLLNSGRPFDHIPPTAQCRKRFVSNGYAWVDVDVRGSGASYGSRACEWSPDEIRDGAEIVDWIVRQPWSNGSVGALGISYDGASAEFVLLNRHPAVKAIAPRFSLFDAYTDVAFPGGIHATWFTETWGRFNDALDRNAPHEVAGWWVKLLVTGVQPVQEDHDRSLRAGAIAAHGDNYDVHQQALTLTFRDDVAPSDPYHHGDNDFRLVGSPVDRSGSISLFSPHNYWHDIEASGAPIYSYGGWFDGAYAHSAIKRFSSISTAGSRLTLGPWNHGGRWFIDPVAKQAKSAFDHNGELLRFFDLHLKKNGDSGLGSEPRVHYFTMVENRWKSSDVWPPPAITRTCFLAADGILSLDSPTTDGTGDRYVVDRTVGTGERSRWRTQVAVGVAVRYPDRAKQDARLLTYTSSPLDRAVEVTGHPIIDLFVTSDRDDGTIFAYLEDVDPRGGVTYVTEGQLRFVHRQLSTDPAPHAQAVPYRTFARAQSKPLEPGEIARLTFDLLPTSYVFEGGHRVRLALAGVDASHFALLPGGPSTLYLHRSRLHPSRIDLPVVST